MFGPTSGADVESPLVKREWPLNHNFVDGAQVIATQVVSAEGGARAPARAFPAAGPYSRLYWNPAEVKAAIVTCGGLCPGLNSVVREITMALTFVYGVPRGNIYGIQSGYRGFYELPWLSLTPESVAHIHALGGTVLGSSRGGFDAERILNALEARGVNMVFAIGGDGTHRGAMALQAAANARGMRLCIAGVPKTVDRDIPVIDSTFGFDTAVEAAVKTLTCAHTEALAAHNGIGLVKLMGRSAGWIAAFASLASREVNITLLPEADWSLAKLTAFLEKRLATRDHVLIAIAEGAEPVELKEAKAKAAAAGAGAVPRDESGNPILDDVGAYLRDAIVAHFKKADKPATLKYIDPSYIIRSQPPNASDSNLCTALAFNACHGAMAGFTGFTCGVVDGQHVWLPVSRLASMPPRTVDPLGRLYARLCATTGQPKLI